MLDSAGQVSGNLLSHKVHVTWCTVWCVIFSIFSLLPGAPGAQYIEHGKSASGFGRSDLNGKGPSEGMGIFGICRNSWRMATATAKACSGGRLFHALVCFSDILYPDFRSKSDRSSEDLAGRPKEDPPRRLLRPDRLASLLDCNGTEHADAYRSTQHCISLLSH